MKKKKLRLIHTSLSYEPADQNLKRIELFYKIFPKLAYGHHYKNILPIILSLNSNIKDIFVYIKGNQAKNRHYPDDIHAFSFKEIKNLSKKINECIDILGSKNKRNSIIKTINDKKISF